MKKIYLFIGLVFFLSNIFMFDLIHLWNEIQIEQEVEAHLSENTKGRSTFTVANLNSLIWERSGKEFLKDGKLYDVISITPTSIGYQIVAISDEAEDELKENWAKFKKLQEKENSSSNTILSEYSAAPFLPSNQIVLPHFMISFAKQKFYLLNESHASNFTPGILIPPPEFC